MIKKMIAMTALAMLFSGTSYAQREMPKADASTQAMVNLCQDTADQEGQNFCCGFGEGVYQANMINRDSRAAKTICVPEGMSRRDVLADFIKWSRANPQYDNDQAAATVMRYLPLRFPCKG